MSTFAQTCLWVLLDLREGLRGRSRQESVACREARKAWPAQVHEYDQAPSCWACVPQTPQALLLLTSGCAGGKVGQALLYTKELFRVSWVAGSLGGRVAGLNGGINNNMC